MPVKDAAAMRNETLRGEYLTEKAHHTDEFRARFFALGCGSNASGPRVREKSAATHGHRAHSFHQSGQSLRDGVAASDPH
jgi:hypothetical protein